MAMFLSRIKQILNLGTKSITANGTYNASTDGYDGYSSVEVNVAGVTPTPITPSNSSPAAMTANTPVNPTANGYAIASYDSVTPSSTPTSVSSGDIVKVGGSGVIVDAIPVPTSITPSNWSPAEMTTGNAYTPSANALAIEYGKLQQATPSNSSPVSVSGGIAYNIGPSSSASGYLIESYSNLAPSDSSPATITSGNIYKATANGKAVASVTSKTPSDSSPASVSSGEIVKAGASGYLYATQQPKAMNVTLHHGSSSVSNYSIISNIGWNKLKLVSSTSTVSTANQYAIDSGSLTSVSVGSIINISSASTVKIYLNRTGENTAVWQFYKE